MAGLPSLSPCVSVGPPLLARGPSRGSAPLRSPALDRPQVPSLARLCPSEVIAPEGPQSAPWLLATMVFSRVALRPLVKRPPTPDGRSGVSTFRALPAIVLFVLVSVPELL